MLRVEPDHPADYYDRPEEALDIYREAIAAGDARALTESGAGLARLGKTDEAEWSAALSVGRLLHRNFQIKYRGAVDRL